MVTYIQEDAVAWLVSWVFLQASHARARLEEALMCLY